MNKHDNPKTLPNKRAFEAELQAARLSEMRLLSGSATLGGLVAGPLLTTWLVVNWIRVIKWLRPHLIAPVGSKFLSQPFSTKLKAAL